MKKFLALAVSVMFFISLAAPARVYADYEADDDFFSFVIEYMIQRNTAAQLKGFYDQFAETGVSLETAWEIAKSYVSGMYTDRQAALAAIKTTYKNLTDDEQFKLIDFHNQVSVYNDFSVDKNTYSQYNWDVFLPDVQDNTTYTEPVPDGSALDSYFPVSKEYFRETIAPAYVGHFPGSYYAESVEEFSSAAEAALVYSYIDLYVFSTAQSYRFSDGGELVPGNSWYTYGFLVGHDNDIKVDVVKSAFGSSWITNYFQGTYVPSIGFTLCNEYMAFSSYDDHWLRTDGEAIVPLKQESGTAVFVSEPQPSLYGRYLILPGGFSSPSDMYGDNITNVYNTYNDIQYVTYTDSDPSGNDPGWLGIIRDIVGGLSVPTVNITVNIGTPEPTPAPEMDFTEILEALEVIAANQAETVSAIDAMSADIAGAVSGTGSDIVASIEGLETGSTTNNYYTGPDSGGGMDASMLIGAVDRNAQLIIDKLSEFSGGLGEGLGGLSERADAAVIVLLLIFCFFMVFFVLWLFIWACRFIWSQILRVWL